MAVTDSDSHDAGEHVEIAASLMVKQPLHVSLVDEHRTLVERQHRRTEILPADLADTVIRQALQARAM